MKLAHKGLVRFDRDLQAKCKKHNIKIITANSATIPYAGNIDMQVSGYFDSLNGELAVAKGKDLVEWVEILIHESCHLDQFVEGTKVWHSGDYCEVDASTIVDLWLNNIVDIKPRLLDEMIKKIIRLERDCDLRSIEKIKKYGLDDIIDLKRYVQKSNAYHLSYVAVKRLRKWNKPKKAAYQVDAVSDAFSDKMSKSFSITAKQFNLMKKHCY